MAQTKPDPRSAQFELIGKIVAYMNARGFYVWHQPNSGRFDADYAAERLVELVLTLRKLGQSYPKAQIEKAIKSALAKSWRRIPHMTKGVADIIGLHGSGKFVAVEVKIGNDRLSDDQRTWIARVQEYGGRVVEVGTFAEFERLFTSKKPVPDVQAVPGESK